MSTDEKITGLACPNCKGRVEIPEGQRIVICPYCDQRSLVRGERGVLRYQVPRQIDRDRALAALKGFMKGMNRAPDLANKARLTELFVAYLPFWSVWAKVAGWVFGEKRIGSGERQHYEPREVKVLKPMNWNAPACDVAEFGVETVRMEGRPLQSFQAAALHADGMVFEPVGSSTDGERLAEATFGQAVQATAHLDRMGSVFSRLLNRRAGLVYFPLYVARYDYRGRTYQAVIDGHSGEVLYGKAPGNTWYRGAALVLGMAMGSLIMVDGTALAFALLNQSNGDNSFLFLFAPLVVGAALMWAAYRRFRYGEQIEHRAASARRPMQKGSSMAQVLNELGVRLEL